MNKKYHRSRAGFEEYCRDQKIVPLTSRYLFAVSQSFMDSSGDVFSNTDMEFAYQAWFGGFAIGFEAEIEGIEDNRIGICDKINPDLMKRKLRDW